MGVKQVSPYVNFNGNASDAIAVYQRVLGAVAVNVMRFGDVPGMPVDEASKGRVIHAVLKIGPGVLMLSDSMPGQAVAAEGNAHVSLDFDTVAEMTDAFAGLAAGGRVTMPLQDTFWGAKFGMLTDAFGVQWMFNANVPK